MIKDPKIVTDRTGKSDSLEPFRPLMLIICLVIGIIIWLLPVPESVDPKGWHLLAIFVATIAGLILKPIPMGATAILAISATAFTGTLSINDSLSGFSNNVIWLIVAAFFISRGFIKTGLGARIAYLFMSLLGKTSLGLAYGLVATDLVLAPAIPSNTARAGGIVFPILRSLAKVFGSEPNTNTSRKIGAFLTKTSFQGTVITSAMFLTAMAANPLAAKLAGDQGVHISWGNWALAALVPGIISIIVIPLFIYWLYPRKLKKLRMRLKLQGTN